MDSRLQEAIQFATEAHEGQFRDGPSPLPYVTHPWDVLHRVYWRAGVRDDDVLVAAVLHDVIEESGVQGPLIESRFGPRVLMIVEQLTRTEPSASEASGLSKKALYELRTSLMLVDIRDRMGPEAKLIKLADRLSNLEEAIQVRTPAKLARYKAQSAAILSLIPRSIQPRLWEDLESLIESAQCS